MNIVMVGARAFPIIKAGVAIAELLATFNKDEDTIHTRTGDSGPDAFIAEAAGIMGFKTRRWKGEGGASNYIRDVDMVKQADIVYAFFDADHVGEGGTQHVIDKSLDQHKRTLSYIWDGHLVLIGSADPGEGAPGDHAEAAWGVSKVPGEAAAERTRSRSASPEERGPVWGSTVGGSGQGHDEASSEG